MPDTRNDKLKITAAFRSLRKQGFFARQKWQCCMTCGVAALPEGTDKWAFYHAQDADAFRMGRLTPQDRFLHQGLAIAFGSTMENGKAVVAAFEAEGMKCDWNGTLEHRILVMPRKEHEWPHG